jgi:uncharacterized lipoprotein YehR (DUF1307 family)
MNARRLLQTGLVIGALMFSLAGCDSKDDPTKALVDDEGNTVLDRVHQDMDKAARQAEEARAAAEEQATKGQVPQE